ncbi:MAG: helix-turn-helix transcriptional regulator [Bacteroidales bacterium]|nr:helix-turn-helix transcriptional regulator [Bacteroidales bacterium]
MNTNINIAFGKRVAALRKKQKLSQEALAERCSLFRTYIGAIERGEKSPTLNTIEKIAEGLRVSIVELFKD